MCYFGEVVHETSIDVAQLEVQSEMRLVGGRLSLSKGFDVRIFVLKLSGINHVAEVLNLGLEK